MIAFSTTTFRDSLKKLSRRYKKHYGSCPKDICDEFNGSSIEHLSSKPNTRLCGAGSYSILKIRVANSGSNIGQSGGFRVIAAANKETSEITPLYVYPKRGPKGADDISDKFRNDLIKTFLKERQAKTLVRVDLTNELAEINEEITKA